MKSSQAPRIALAAGLSVCLGCLAQPGPMRAPTMPQAIETQLQQQRTLQQREAIDAAAASAPPVQDPPAPKKAVVRKATKAPGQRSARKEPAAR